MVRRLALVGFIGAGYTFLPKGSVTQIWVASMFCLLYTFSLVLAHPYHNTLEGLMAISSSVGLCLVFSVFVLFQVNALLKLPFVEASFREQDADLYRTPSTLLVIVMILSFLAAFLLLTVVLGIQRMKRGRALQEAIKLQGRLRLRYVATDCPVSAPPLPSGHYHIFLSHVWQSGQDTSAPTAHDSCDCPRPRLC